MFVLIPYLVNHTLPLTYSIGSDEEAQPVTLLQAILPLEYSSD